MNTYLILKGNEIINTILWDGVSNWTPPEGTTAVIAPEGVGIGWTKSGSNWIAPEPPAPPEPEPEDPNKVSARAKLAALGLTEDEITALLGA
jgi:hypothetical protein